MGLTIISLVHLGIGLLIGFIGFSQPQGSYQELIFYSGLSVLNILLAVGLILRNKIARLFSLIFSYIGIAMYCFLIYNLIIDIQRGGDTFYGIMAPLFLPSAILAVFCVVYLNLPKVKELFK